MGVFIGDEVLRSAGLSQDELKLEIALHLYAEERLTVGQAAALAEIAQIDLLRAAAARGIAIHYGVDELEQDLTNLAEIEPA